MSDPAAHLLLVDDNVETLSIYQNVLSRAGYQVATARNSSEALARVRSETFHLVLTDLRMSDGSGLELLAEVRRDDARLPVVIMTAFGSEALRDASKILGASDFVDKPPELDELIDVVQRNLQRHRHTSEVVRLGHAARRWATIVVPLVRCADDVPTVNDWGIVIASAPSTIKAWCKVAGVSGGDSLDFGRAMRVVVQHHGRRCDWYRELSIVSQSTLDRFLARAGLRRVEPVPEVATFFSRQRLIAEAELLHAVSVLLVR